VPIETAVSAGFSTCITNWEPKGHTRIPLASQKLAWRREPRREGGRWRRRAHGMFPDLCQRSRAHVLAWPIAEALAARL
jgi:hypothetical protein